MDEYVHADFYDVRHLKLKDRIRLMEDAKSKCFNWWVDESPQWKRELIEMPFEEIMAKFNMRCHFTFVHRKGYKNQKERGLSYYLEIAFSTIDIGNQYFLWLQVDDEYLDYFVNKYNLKTRIK